MPAAGLWCWAYTVLGQGTEFPSCGHSAKFCLLCLEMDAAQLCGALGMRWAGWLVSVEELGFSDKPGISAYL